MEKIFKAKRIDNGGWYVFYLADLIDRTEDFNAFDKKTICQYTGIKDKEGNRIFEGDEVYVAGVGKLIAAITLNGVTFSGWDFQSLIEDIEKLTGHNIHDK